MTFSNFNTITNVTTGGIFLLGLVPVPVTLFDHSPSGLLHRALTEKTSTVKGDVIWLPPVFTGARAIAKLKKACDEIMSNFADSRPVRSNFCCS